MTRLDEIKKLYRNLKSPDIINSYPASSEFIYSSEDYIGWLISRVERLENGLNNIKLQATSTQPTTKDKLYFDLAEEALSEEDAGNGNGDGF